MHDAGDRGVPGPETGVRPDLPPASIRAVGFVFAGLFFLGALLPRHPDLDATFGLEAFEGRWPLYAAMTLLLLMLLNVPGAARRMARGLVRAASRVPLPTALLAVGSGVLFLLVRDHRLSGDGPTFVSMTASGEIYPSNALTCDLHQLVDAIPGVVALDAIRITDAVAGVVYVLACLAIARTCFADCVRRAGLTVLLLSTGSVALFFGSVEVYAPLVAGIAVYLLVGLRHLRGEGRGVLPPLVLGVTFALHGSAGLLLPSLVLLANGGRLRPLCVRRWVGWGALFLVPVLIVLAVLWFGTWDGTPPAADHQRFGGFGGAMGQAPILPLVRSDANLTHRYAMLDLEHLLGVANVWILAAPAGLALLFLGRRSLLRAPGALWVASVTVFLLAFPVFWNVSYALRHDWDLFSPVGVPLTLLGGVAFLGRIREGRTVVSVAALALYAFVPFVIANTGTRSERVRYAEAMTFAYGVAESRSTGTPREEAREERVRWSDRVTRMNRVGDQLSRANVLRDAGRLAEAEQAYRRVLEIEPESLEALLNLGTMISRSGRRHEGRELLEEAVRAEPGCYATRYQLAWSYADEGRLDEAAGLLRKTVRYACADPRVVEALNRLEQYWTTKGDLERARLMSRLADERR